MKKYLRLLLPATMLLALLLAACGDSDSDANGDANGDTAPAAGTQAPAASTPDGNGDDGGNGGDGGGSGGPGPRIPGAINNDGTIIIDGESYAAQTVFRCEPFDDGENNLDLTALTGGVTVFVNVVEFSGMFSHSVDLQGPMGLYGGTHSQVGEDWFDEDFEPVDGPPFEMDGNRIRGAITVIEFREGLDTLDVSFELPIPETIVDCQL